MSERHQSWRELESRRRNVGGGCTELDLVQFTVHVILNSECLTEQIESNFSSIFIQQTTKLTIAKLFPYILAPILLQRSWSRIHWIEHNLIPKVIQCHCQFDVKLILD
jgi:lipoate-protein ligase A